MLSHKYHFKVSHESVLKIIFSHEHQNKTLLILIRAVTLTTNFYIIHLLYEAYMFS